MWDVTFVHRRTDGNVKIELESCRIRNMPSIFKKLRPENAKMLKAFLIAIGDFGRLDALLIPRPLPTLLVAWSANTRFSLNCDELGIWVLLPNTIFKNQCKITIYFWYLDPNRITTIFSCIFKIAVLRICCARRWIFYIFMTYPSNACLDYSIWQNFTILPLYVATGRQQWRLEVSCFWCIVEGLWLGWQGLFQGRLLLLLCPSALLPCHQHSRHIW